jgi:hypothetical protein
VRTVRAACLDWLLILTSNGFSASTPSTTTLTGTHAIALRPPSLAASSRAHSQGIDTAEIIATVHARRAPMMSATAGLRL